MLVDLKKLKNHRPNKVATLEIALDQSVFTFKLFVNFEKVNCYLLVRTAFRDG